MTIYQELKRRNVFRVGAAYIVAAWLLIQVAETIFPLFGFGDAPARITVIVLAIGFPMFLLFSWVFELTPEGLKKEKDIDRAVSITQKSGQQLDRIIIVLLALALGYFAFDKFILEPVRVVEIVEETAQQARTEALLESYGDQSIAVLPFINMSADPEQEYFSDGISEELLNLLAKIPELRVIARTSSFSYKGKDIKINDVARELNVGYVLEGSVRKGGERVRITAQLIDARSDTHLWSEIYDRELDDIFAVQDEISAAIVGALGEHLGLRVGEAPQAMAAANTDAHDAYLRGRHLVVQRTHADIERAVHEFEKAIRHDPRYALAHAELAMAIMLLHRDEYGDLTGAEVIAKATPHTRSAMLVKPPIAEAYAASGFLTYLEGNIDLSLAFWQQAIATNPNYSIVHTWLAILHLFLGHYEEAFVIQEKAVRLDPLSGPAIHNYSLRLMERNRLEEAEREMGKLASTHPSWYAGLRGDLTSIGGNWSNWALGTLDGLKVVPGSRGFRRELSAALALIGLEQEALNISTPIESMVLRLLGFPGDAVALVEAKLAEDPTRMYTRFDLGLSLAAAGNFARARPILEEVWQWNKGRVAHSGEFKIDHAAALFAIHSAADVDTGELLRAIRENVHRYRKAGMTVSRWNFSADFEDGLVTYLTGDHEQGLALIAKGAENGYFIKSREVYLQTLYEDPGFAPILAGQESRRARERKRFLAVVCTDNPYATVWQPGEETCEQFDPPDPN